MNHQNGSLYKQGKSWNVRYWEQTRLADGTYKRVRRSQYLGPKSLLRSEAVELQREFMARINRVGVSEVMEPGVTLCSFVEREYFPALKEEGLAEKTIKGYRYVWKVHGVVIDPRLRLRDFTTYHGQTLLRAIAQRSDLTTRTHQYIRSFFSAVFSHALRLGLINGVNPISEVKTPKGRESAETYAYEVEEIESMLSVLTGQAYTAVLIAACTGLRRSEIEGLCGGDWDRKRQVLNVSRARVESRLKETKSRESRAAVPCVQMLTEHLAGLVTDDSKPILQGITGVPLDLHNLTNRIIVPTLKAREITWRGWHPFRRGLGSFLNAQGVADVVIQRILRHSSVAITQKHYIKVRDPRIADAMSKVTFDVLKGGKSA